MKIKMIINKNEKINNNNDVISDIEKKINPFHINSNKIQINIQQKNIKFLSK